MKKVHEFEIVPKVIIGITGSVDAFDAIEEEILAGVRIIKQNSDVKFNILILPHIA